LLSLQSQEHGELTILDVDRVDDGGDAEMDEDAAYSRHDDAGTLRNWTTNTSTACVNPPSTTKNIGTGSPIYVKITVSSLRYRRTAAIEWHGNFQHDVSSCADDCRAHFRNIRDQKELNV
jgi:hypothetical protein